MKQWLQTLLLIWIILSSGAGQAHLTQFSRSQLKAQQGKVSWDLQFHLGDFQRKFSRVSDEQILTYLPERLSLWAGEQICTQEQSRLQRDQAKEWVEIHLVFSCPATPGPLQVRYGLFLGDLSHRHFLSYPTNAGTSELTFSPASSFHEWTPLEHASGTSGFFSLGVEHILLGFDHILFLIALLFGARQFKTLLYLITAFTLAHSLTLGLASLEYLQLSPQWVEPLIALSILVVVLWDGFARSHRKATTLIAITFAFGLIHGLGFSFLLKATLENTTNLWKPLLLFNLGVEAGQLLLVAIFFPLLHWSEKRFPTFYSPFRKVCLVGIAGMALYWLILRIA